MPTCGTTPSPTPPRTPLPAKSTDKHLALLRGGGAGDVLPSDVEIRVLGPLEMVGPRGPVVLHGYVQRTLLARLGVRPGETVSRGALIDALWSDAAPAKALRTLRSHVAHLRREMRDAGLPGLIATRDPGYALLVPAEAVDAVRFEILAARGRDALAAADAPAAAESLRAALGLWRGEALADCRSHDWMGAEITRLGELRLAATEDVIGAELALGKHAAAVGELESLIVRYLFRERLWELLMLALYRAGRQADALAAFQRARTALVDELGVEPGRQLRRLEAAILAADPALELPTGHRSTVLTSAAAGGAASAGASHVAGAASGEAGNLPVEVTSFVGREQEINAVKQAVSGARLVTLTGVGGVGKTRLAVRVAADLRPAFPHGVWLVELAGLQDPTLIAHTFAATLRIHDQTGREPLAVLADYLRDRQALVVLDNCEHLLDTCAPLVEALLHAAAGLRILATSRQTLATAGEHVVSVPSLPVPDVDQPLPPEAYRRSAAMALFAERAAASIPEGFAVTPQNQGQVVRICHRLDGIPLAIELAAVRLRTLSPHQLLSRLDDRFRLLSRGRRSALARQQTLRATIDWSFELCTPKEQTLWARLSVFAGSFDLSAAEAVCAGDGIAPEDIIDLVDGLVDKSVLAREEHPSGLRFRLLETIRQYGRDQLRGLNQDATLRRQHRDWYLHLAEQGETDWFGPHQLEWSTRLQLEHANLRAALDYCLTTPGESQPGLRLAAALYFYWVACGGLPEGRHWLDQALKLDVEPTRQRAKALWVCGRIANVQGDTAASVTLLQQCQTLARHLGDDTALACATHMLGAATLFRDNPAYAAELLEEALARYRDRDEVNSMVVMAQLQLSIANTFQGNTDKATALSQTARAICATHGEQWTLSYALYTLAFAEWASGEAELATEHAEECLRIKRIFHDILGIGMAVDLLAWIATDQGESERAAVLLGAAQTTWHAVGVPWFGSQNWRTPHEESQAWARHILGDQTFEAAFRRGTELTLNQTITLALGDNSDRSSPS
jgi:predicted ATPase/DNA-binding SARP family transcriptional activator